MRGTDHVDSRGDALRVLYRCFVRPYHLSMREPQQKEHHAERQRNLQEMRPKKSFKMEALLISNQAAKACVMVRVDVYRTQLLAAVSLSQHRHNGRRLHPSSLRRLPQNINLSAESITHQDSKRLGENPGDRAPGASRLRVLTRVLTLTRSLSRQAGLLLTYQQLLLLNFLDFPLDF